MKLKAEKLIELLENKINEAENCEEADIKQLYLSGYINGLNMAITIINEQNLEI